MGGAIHVSHSSPRIVRNVIYRNAARIRGSGIYVTDSSTEIANNNTIVRRDSNGILLRGDSPALVMDNVIAENGPSGRGRGICDFSSGGSAVIAYMFSRNRIAALLTDQTDFRRVAGAQQRIGSPRLVGSVDGSPELTGRQPIANRPLHLRTPLSKLVRDLVPRADARRRRALDSGNPDPSLADLDGTRNDLGFTGGPDAFRP